MPSLDDAELRAPRIPVPDSVARLVLDHHLRPGPGWIATRSGGHYATNRTHNDVVGSVRMITPAGWWESRRLPGSGASPSPDRMVIGSEGVYGIITEARMRILRRPTFRATAGVTFESWQAGCDAVRRIVQAKLWPGQPPHPRPRRGPPDCRPRRRAGAGDRVVRVRRVRPAPQHRRRGGDSPRQRWPR
ncbi:MAG: hypothetical protein F4110_02795 [Acidimicrobiaceae bacterium]|nr:hypothetical protein [Acidimicrobiaceae bacterium]MXZ97608.1 hypothetical protein [Acidimicrobiaceae bacterium]MYE76801.1 hypothetical protein [Acidimicrobiaceae bacterium]MYE96282.1 hypothetical protein [Acidimicrobiaceae bacterium]MYH44164.1 hypothetical protein [Acidimicrobiaceae bacterium]